MRINIFIISLLTIAGLGSCNGSANVKPLVQTEVHSSCLDSSSQYHLVKGLIGSSQYNSKRTFYSPVRGVNGVIKHDFNHDNAIDYVFLERKPSELTARLMLCMSNGRRGYKRIKTAFSAREFKNMDYYVESTSIIHKGDSLSIFDSTHAHNDGGTNRSFIFAFNLKRAAFTLRKHESSSSGQGFLEMSQTFDLQNQRYIEETGCTFSGDSASIAFEPDCKPRKISQCLRDDGVIFIGDAINHEQLRKRVIACK